MRAAALALAAFGSLPFVLPGCSGASVANLCDRVCECTGCSDLEYEDCIDDGEDLEKAAEEAGCNDAWEDYLSCIDEELECNDGDVKVDGCLSEIGALGNCAAENFGEDGASASSPSGDTPTSPAPAPGG
jgi:hypothetical protein